jgi:type IV pilus assembly protein PilV
MDAGKGQGASQPRFIHLRPSLCTPAFEQRGFLLIEILVSLLVMAFGLLALAGFVTKATALAVDSTQRNRAALLLSDMAGRMVSNKNQANSYITASQPGSGYGTPGVATVCPGSGVAGADLCNWHNLLQGTNDAQAGGNATALGYRGCLSVDPVTAIFTITVAWGATTPTELPGSDCGKNQFGADEYRRILRTTIRIPNLTG